MPAPAAGRWRPKASTTTSSPLEWSQRSTAPAVPIQLGAHGQREGLAAHWEMWMFEQGGMTPHHALRAATINGARYIGMDADLGSLEAGKLADLIVLEQNPLENLRSSELVRYVMIGGRIFDAVSMNEIAGEKEQRKPFWFQR